jgi:hypothetical protein
LKMNSFLLDKIPCWRRSLTSRHITRLVFLSLFATSRTTRRWAFLSPRPNHFS